MAQGPTAAARGALRVANAHDEQRGHAEPRHGCRCCWSRGLREEGWPMGLSGGRAQAGGGVCPPCSLPSGVPQRFLRRFHGDCAHQVAMQRRFLQTSLVGSVQPVWRAWTDWHTLSCAHTPNAVTSGSCKPLNTSQGRSMLCMAWLARADQTPACSLKMADSRTSAHPILID